MDRRVRVLFVDGDDDPTPVSPERLAERDGLDVERGTAREAAESDADAYDCVVTNVALADGDGVELARALGESAPSLPVVLYTAVGDELVARDALRAGAADYVVADGGSERSDEGNDEAGGRRSDGDDEDENGDEAATLERRVRAAAAESGRADAVSGRSARDDECGAVEEAAQLAALDRAFRHDIRNDMAVIVGWADILRDHVDADGEDILDRILENGRHTLELTDVAGDAAATITGEGTATVEPTDLGEALREAVESRREAFPEATVELGDIPDCRVAANPLLGSAFRSLLNDAVSNHRGDDPTIRVSAERDGDVVRVRVADGRRGDADAPRNPPLGSDEARQNPDAGIDRYLVERLVDAYGGRVRADGAAAVVELRAVD